MLATLKSESTRFKYLQEQLHKSEVIVIPNTTFQRECYFSNWNVYDFLSMFPEFIKHDDYTGSLVFAGLHYVVFKVIAIIKVS